MLTNRIAAYPRQLAIPKLGLFLILVIVFIFPGCLQRRGYDATYHGDVSEKVRFGVFVDDRVAYSFPGRMMFDQDDLTLVKAREGLKNAITEARRIGGGIEDCRTMLEKLREFGKNAVCLVPEPYWVYVLTKRTGNNKGKLFVYWIERDSDVRAVHVREYWPSGQEISEIYELSMKTRSAIREKAAVSWSHRLEFAVTERTSPELRMDAPQWRASLLPFGQHQPPMLIAKPTDQVHIQISLIDQCGHESRPLELTCWVGEDEIKSIVVEGKQSSERRKENADSSTRPVSQ